MGKRGKYFSAQPKMRIFAAQVKTGKKNFLLSASARILSGIIGFLFCLNIFAQDKTIPDGPAKFTYPGGKTSSEGTIKNGKPEGYWKSYYENGTLKSEGNRVNFKLDGVWKFYTDSGLLKSELNYSAGKKQGIQKTFLENGKLFSEEKFSDDVRQGNTNYYHENGQLQKTIPFTDGTENGTGREFAPDGTVITLIEYKKGYVVKEEKINRTDRAGMKYGWWREFFPDSTGQWKVKSEGLYKDNKKQQIWKTYDESGKVTKEELYINGELAVKEQDKDQVKLDIRKEYHPNGKVKSSGSYNKGVQEGVFREYTPDGKIYDAKVYKAGKLIRQGLLGEDGLEQGPWKEFYESGKLRAEGNYENGKRTGNWKFYYESGSPEQEGNYRAGKPDGKWRWYYQSRRLLREETFRNGLEDGLMREFTDNDSSSVDWFVITEGNFSDGKREGLWKFHSDEIITEGNYTEGKEDGLWKTYFYEPGKSKEQLLVDFEGAYSAGYENGLHKYFFSDGKPREERNYGTGEREGIWKRWDKEGNLILTTQYEAGKEMRYDGIKIPEVETPGGK